jgi:hypothetical protein
MLSLLYPGSRIGTRLPNQLFFQKNVADANFSKCSPIFFYFQCKNNNFEKKKNPKISALFFWNYFMPNLLPSYGTSSVKAGS